MIKQGQYLNYEERNEMIEAAVARSVETALESEESLFQLTERLAGFAGRYSASNIFMILYQMPDARMCRSKAAWQKEGYRVYQGQDPILIMSPVTAIKVIEDGQEVDLDMVSSKTRKLYHEGNIKGRSVSNGYKYIHTYDISQTNAPEAFLQKEYRIRFSEYEYGYLMDILAKYTKEAFNIELKSIYEVPDLRGLGLDSAYDFPSIGRGTIYLNPTLSDREAISCFLKELTRKLLPNYGTVTVDVITKKSTSATTALYEAFDGDWSKMLKCAEAADEFRVDFMRTLFMTRYGMKVTDEEKYRMYRRLNEAKFDDSMDIFSLYKTYQCWSLDIEKMVEKLLPQKRTFDMPFEVNRLCSLVETATEHVSSKVNEIENYKRKERVRF